MTLPAHRSVITALAEAQIDFILVGALAAIVRGAPFATLDVDIVHCRRAENLDRLHALLLSIDAHYRGRPADQRLVPTREHLDTSGHVLLKTSLGPLDVLGTIEGGRDYDSLAKDAQPLMLFDENVLVPTLDMLIALKREGKRAQDPLKLLTLQATAARIKAAT